jgi:glycosyltransferase involved in cell wall biosynthesis
MARLSVVIALYNKQKYIAQCIQSVLNQTFSDFELIIVDDGSTDGSVEIVKTFQDKRIVLVSQANAGPGVARNHGVSLSRTDLLAFLDADDTWNPLFLETGIARLDEHAVDVYVCGADWEPRGEKRLPVLPSEGLVQSGVWKVPLNLVSEELNAVMNFFATGAVLIRKKVFQTYGGFFDRVRCNSGEDAYLWIQIMFNHAVYRELTPLLTVNTEGSDLGIGRKTIKPIPPSVLYPEHLQKNCPSSYLPSLKLLLNYIAFRAFRREVYQLHLSRALRLVLKFPGLAKERPADFPPVFLSFFLIPIQKYWTKLRRNLPVLYI